MSLLQLSKINVPADSVLGINYCGMHDTALVLVAPDGTILFAISLERISRVKMDGRRPTALLEEIPWNRIAKVALSTESVLNKPDQTFSQLHPIRLTAPHSVKVVHKPAFYEFVKRIPCEVEFVCHRISHVASSFWGSEFDEALCMNYDGGMANDPWFGGLYRANRDEGIVPLDQFSAEFYAKITLLYQVITALLGFTACKHEGKVTGLAAYGKPRAECRALFDHWLKDRFPDLEKTLRWSHTYNEAVTASIVPNGLRMQEFCKDALKYSREDIAATLQDMAERHVLEILSKAKDMGWMSSNICLSGGLFANVKINQKISEFGFKKIFVAPPMTDDGTALGAAWQVLSQKTDFKPSPLRSMYLGPSYSKETIRSTVENRNIRYEQTQNPAWRIAELLADGAVVAIFQGSMEFGPRALGNRSILASAADPTINQKLNQRLNRTEFMPFAPICRMEDAELCFENIDRIRHAAEFMTVTVNCRDILKKGCPAIVHVDGTARPQLVTSEINPILHSVLYEYQKITGLPVLVNTSFNIHEEPIVCSPEDALRGFFEAGLDYLYLEGAGIISFQENLSVAIQYMQEKLRTPSIKQQELLELNKLLEQELNTAKRQLEEKEVVIQNQILALKHAQSIT